MTEEEKAAKKAEAEAASKAFWTKTAVAVTVSAILILLIAGISSSSPRMARRTVVEPEQSGPPKPIPYLCDYPVLRGHEWTAFPNKPGYKMKISWDYQPIDVWQNPGVPASIKELPEGNTELGTCKEDILRIHPGSGVEEAALKREYFINM